MNRRREINHVARTCADLSVDAMLAVSVAVVIGAVLGLCGL